MNFMWEYFKWNFYEGVCNFMLSVDGMILKFMKFLFWKIMWSE